MDEDTMDAAREGYALPDGSLPTRDCGELRAAVQQAGDSPTPKIRRYLIRRSIDLGCTEHIPDSWEVS